MDREAFETSFSIIDSMLIWFVSSKVDFCSDLLGMNPLLNRLSKELKLCLGGLKKLVGFKV